MINRRNFLIKSVKAGIIPGLSSFLSLPLIGGTALIPYFSQEAEGFQSVAPPHSANPQRPGTVLDRLVPHIHPELDLHNPNTREFFRGAYYDPLSGYDVEAIKALNWFWRDWRQGVARQVDVRLFWALSAIRQAAMKEGHSGRMMLNSGYRTPATNDMLSVEGAAHHSMHLAARASDIVLPNVPTEVLYRFALFLGIGGVGHYPNRFVHIDSGPGRTWLGLGRRIGGI